MQLPVGVTRGTSASGLAYVDIMHPKARARIYLQGAHITAFQSAGKPPLLWLSEDEDLQPNKAIRGGIPICWPWFGAQSTESSAPAHGFARTCIWNLERVVSRADGVTLTLTLAAAPRANWPHHAHLSLVVGISDSLSLALTTRNTGPAELPISQALHTYFDVVDITKVEVTGLHQSQYDDQLLGSAGLGLACTEDVLTFGAEFDRIYYPTQPIGVRTPRYHLQINTQGSNSAVIWNPWVDKSARLSHFPAHGYQSMLCVETANCGADSLLIAAGDAHTLAVEYRQVTTGKN